jgi:hypothetical protein
MPRRAFYREGWTLWVDPYKLIWRPLMFKLDAETAHHTTMWMLEWIPTWFILLLNKPRQLLP